MVQKMIDVTDRSRCCGCTACKAICPHDAITMKEDALGFPYPVVDMDRCVDCGLCERVCDFVREHPSLETAGLELDVLAARNRCDAAVRESQSGGAFTALSDVILSSGGVVYGAAMKEDFTVGHMRAVTTGERDRMRGSKYVQSDMGDIFRQVKEDLSQGRKVLFAGTPCQVAGLASYVPEGLKKNLLLLDFICHGVPSPAVWKDYVVYMSRKGKLKQVCFRDKSPEGWKVHKESFLYETGRKDVRETFRVLFYKNIMLRHSCAVCPYHLGNRKADVTIADFWGVGEVLPAFDGNEGTSMLISHTDKGKELVGSASSSLETAVVKVDGSFLERKNPNLLRPSRIYKDRNQFEVEYAEKGFVHVARRWGDMGWRYKAWQMKSLIRRLTGRK